jgi:DNA anti-recombination protein RmuC
MYDYSKLESTLDQIETEMHEYTIDDFENLRAYLDFMNSLDSQAKSIHNILDRREIH